MYKKIYSRLSKRTIKPIVAHFVQPCSDDNAMTDRVARKLNIKHLPRRARNVSVLGQGPVTFPPSVQPRV